MLGTEANGFAKCAAPNLNRLAGDREHQIEIQILKAGGAQDFVGLEDHLAGMNSAEPIEQRLIERLDAHRNAIDAKVAPEPGFIGRNRRWIALNGPFVRTKQLQPLHRVEDSLPLAKIEQGRSAPSEKDRLRLQVAVNQLQFPQQRFDVPLNHRAIRGLRVKSAI